MDCSPRAWRRDSDYREQLSLGATILRRSWAATGQPSPTPDSFILVLWTSLLGLHVPGYHRPTEEGLPVPATLLREPQNIVPPCRNAQ